MKFYKKILIGFIIFIAVIIIIALIKNAVNKKEANEIAKMDEQLLQESIESYSEGKTFPRGIAEFTGKYEGQNSKNDLYESLDNLVKKYLPSLFKDINGLSESDLENYFNNHKEEIVENLGINQSDDFVKLAKYLQNYNYNGEEFDSCEIDSNSYRTAGGNAYLSFIINFQYKNKEENMKLRVFFANMTSTTPEIIFASAE